MSKFWEKLDNEISDEFKVKLLAYVMFITVTAIMLFFAVRTYEVDEQNYKIAVITKTIDKGNDFWTSLIDGAKLAAKEYGAELYISGTDSEQDVEGQINYVKKAMEMNPDAIIISPCSYSGMTDVLKEVMDSGIRLFLVDSVIDENIADGIVSTDNFDAGKQLGKYARLNMDKDDKIGIIAHVKGSSTAIQREKGIAAGLGNKSDDIVSTQYCGSSYDRAYELTKQLLEENKEVNVLFGTNEFASVGAARAVKELQRDDVVVYGFDNSIEEIQLLEQGIFKSIIIQKPFNMGYLGVEQAVLSLDGEKIEYYIDSGSKLIDKNNMYEEENQKLLYPFTGQK